jgi:peptidyl-prolyl cis-trans isomerase B (cyclophilin B)
MLRWMARMWCCLVLLTAGFALGACGSSRSGSSASAAARRVGSSGPAIGSARPSGCDRVPAPGSKAARQLAAPTGRLDSSKRYVVTLATNCGRIAIELDVHEAPRTTSSFAYLVRRGFYDDLTFHRVAANYLIQGGDPNGDGSGGPGYTVVERPPQGLRYTQGTVAMAKTETDPSGASGSQFFIVTAPATQLPAQFALVGRVVGSFSAVRAISRLPTDPPHDGAPEIPVVISSATLEASS